MSPNFFEAGSDGCVQPTRFYRKGSTLAEISGRFAPRRFTGFLRHSICRAVQVAKNLLTKLTN
jgi:hypothetical protein